MGRVEKSLKNIAFGIIAQIFTTVITFFSRTVMLKALGIEIVSLNGLFNEIIANLSLAELGIGSAIVYNLYKPLAENDHEKICQLMTFFKQAYRVIAGAILLIGTIVCLFIPLMVNGIDYSNTYMRFVFMLFVINISSSYLFSYKISLLNADQNNYIYSFYGTICSIVGSLLLIGCMLLTKNFVFFLVLSVFVTLATNIILSAVIDRKYPYLKHIPLPASERKGIFSNVKNIFVKELSGRITSSTDNILISTIIGTIVVGK